MYYPIHSSKKLEHKDYRRKNCICLWVSITYMFFPFIVPSMSKSKDIYSDRKPTEDQVLPPYIFVVLSRSTSSRQNKGPNHFGTFLMADFHQNISKQSFFIWQVPWRIIFVNELPCFVMTPVQYIDPNEESWGRFAFNEINDWAHTQIKVFLRPHK